MNDRYKVITRNDKEYLCKDIVLINSNDNNIIGYMS